MKQINTAPIIIGIDPGVSTGIAVWDRNARVFSTITSDGIVGATKGDAEHFRRVMTGMQHDCVWSLASNLKGKLNGRHDA